MTAQEAIEGLANSSNGMVAVAFSPWPPNDSYLFAGREAPSWVEGAIPILLGILAASPDGLQTSCQVNVTRDPWEKGTAALAIIVARQNDRALVIITEGGHSIRKSLRRMIKQAFKKLAAADLRDGVKPKLQVLDGGQTVKKIPWTDKKVVGFRNREPTLTSTPELAEPYGGERARQEPIRGNIEGQGFRPMVPRREPIAPKVRTKIEGDVQTWLRENVPPGVKYKIIHASDGAYFDPIYQGLQDPADDT